jgi:NAD(P)-dependent dehydrogenase (short-subunit alcohol dehydrogenase family)
MHLTSIRTERIVARFMGQFDLHGRVALVTGGSRGMGRSMALGFAAAGADIIIVSRKLESCESVASDILRLTSRRALPVSCHVGEWQQIDALVETAYREFGRVDILVNNAGMSPIYPDLPSISEVLYDKVLGVNLKGPFRLCSLIGTAMMEGSGGSIINVSSHFAVHPDPEALPYSAAKAGLNALTIGLARAFGPTVRVNCIQPGAFLTDISKSWDLEAWRQEADRYALRRGGEPDEIVGTALYLASDASSYTTGAIIPVDGGIR